MEHPRLDIAEIILPPGRFLLAASERGLCRVVLPEETKASFEAWLKKHYPKYQLQDHQGRLGSTIEQLEGGQRRQSHPGDRTLSPRGGRRRTPDGVWRRVAVKVRIAQA